MSVVDASVAVKWFVAEAGHEAAVKVLSSEAELIAPDLVVLETANVLRRKYKRDELSRTQWRRAIEVLPGYFVRLPSSVDLMKEPVELAVELDHPIYDCVYLACAIAVGTVVVTADTHFAGKIERIGRGAQVRRLDDGQLSHKASL